MFLTVPLIISFSNLASSDIARTSSRFDETSLMRVENGEKVGMAPYSDGL